jgi:hypothetical protein
MEEITREEDNINACIKLAERFIASARRGKGVGMMHAKMLRNSLDLSRALSDLRHNGGFNGGNKRIDRDARRWL